VKYIFTIPKWFCIMSEIHLNQADVFGVDEWGEKGLGRIGLEGYAKVEWI